MMIASVTLSVYLRREDGNNRPSQAQMAAILSILERQARKLGLASIIRTERPELTTMLGAGGTRYVIVAKWRISGPSTSVVALGRANMKFWNKCGPGLSIVEYIGLSLATWETPPYPGYPRVKRT